jgi:hypothetical protein
MTGYIVEDKDRSSASHPGSPQRRPPINIIRDILGTHSIN